MSNLLATLTTRLDTYLLARLIREPHPSLLTRVLDMIHSVLIVLQRGRYAVVYPTKQSKVTPLGHVSYRHVQDGVRRAKRRSYAVKGRY